MYSPRDIRSAARRINDAGRELRSHENKVKEELGNIQDWWRGAASQAFTQGYAETGREIGKLYSRIDDLGEELLRLASEVQRADDERRRKEAERLRLQQLKNNIR